MIRKSALVLFVALLGMRPAMALTFDEIKFLPFMGGSLMYNQAKPTESHLAVGGHYAFRLSDLYLKNVAVADLAGLTDAEKQSLVSSNVSSVDLFEEDESKTNYGEIAVTAISGTAIEFDYTLYNSGGQTMYTKAVALGIGQALDMDKDGKFDVEYTTTISSARSNVAGIAYLRFLSSQTGLYASMFSYAPELQAGLTEFDLIGFNPNGNAIIRDRNTAWKISTPGTVSTLKKAAASSFDLTKFKSGDYVLDLTTSTYVPIQNQGGVLAKVAASAQSIETVLPLVVLEQRTPFDLTRQRSTSKNPDSKYLAHDAGQYTLNRNAKFSALTQNGRARFGPYSMGQWIYNYNNTGLKFGIKDPQLSLGIGVSIKILWSKAGVKANVSSGYLFEGDLNVSIGDGTKVPLYSAFTKVTDTLGKKPISFYKANFPGLSLPIPETIISETILFSLGGVPVSWGMDQHINFDFNLIFNQKASVGTKFYMYDMIDINARATVLDGSGIGFGGGTESKTEYLPYYQLAKESRLSVNISPKYSLEPYVKIGPLIKTSLVFYVGFVNDWTVSYTAAESWFRTYLDFVYGLNMDLKIGKTFTLGAFGVYRDVELSKDWSIPIISENYRIYDLGNFNSGVTGAFLDKLVMTNDDKIYVQEKKLWAPMGITGPMTMFLNIPASYSLNNLLQPDYYSETAISARDVNNNFKQSSKFLVENGWNQRMMNYLVKEPTTMTLKFPVKGNYLIYGLSCYSPDLTEACESATKEIKVTNVPIVPTILTPLLLN